MRKRRENMMMAVTDRSNVTVTVEEYTRLLKETEQLAILRRYIERDEYLGMSDIRCILGMEPEEKESPAGRESE